MLKISAVYLIGNPEIPICYPNCALVEQALSNGKFQCYFYNDQPGEVVIIEKQECMTVIYIYSPL